MPTLTLKVAPLRNPTPHQSLAKALTLLTAQHLGKRPEVTAVIIEEVPLGQWHIGGQALHAATALLEISITTGTNTPEQKQAFIAAAFAELQQQLGGGQPLHEASYVIVREVPASDWGYAGITQAARKQLREPTPTAA